LIKSAKMSTRQYKSAVFVAQRTREWRRNPVKACEDLLGVVLMDYQKAMIMKSWTAEHIIWCCSRNAGKSFLVAIFAILKALLFENQRIYIVANTGTQAQETFMKIEDLAKGKIDSVKTDKKILINETVKSVANRDGFTHDKSQYKVEFYNGSAIYALPNNPEGIRGKRATLLIIDEYGFADEKLKQAVRPFLSQERDFALGEGYDARLEKKKFPTQVIMASSASDESSEYYQKYKNYSLRMFMGDSRYVVFDINCEVPLKPTVNGKPVPPLIKKSEIDDMMRQNKEKALREYYNIFIKESEQQAISRKVFTRNSDMELPELYGNGVDKYILSFDPARTKDNSIVMVMKICEEDNDIYGRVVNTLNLIDMGRRKKIPMSFTDQVKYIRKLIEDYKNVVAFYIDGGEGGGGKLYADQLLEDWVDNKGQLYRGIIDLTNPLYRDLKSRYPNARDIMRVIDPRKSKNEMMDEFINLLDMDKIKFLKEYTGAGVVYVEDEGNTVKTRQLTLEEEISLINSDIMKIECTSIYKYETQSGGVKYDLPPDKKNTMNDDRFYAMLMLAHGLHEYRRERLIKPKRKDVNPLKYALFN